MPKKVMEVAVTLRLTYDTDTIKPADFGGESYFAKHVLSSADINGMEVEAGEDEWVTIEYDDKAVGVLSERSDL